MSFATESRPLAADLDRLDEVSASLAATVPSTTAPAPFRMRRSNWSMKRGC